MSAGAVTFDEWNNGPVGHPQLPCIDLDLLPPLNLEPVTWASISTHPCPSGDAPFSWLRLPRPSRFICRGSRPCGAQHDTVLLAPLALPRQRQGSPRRLPGG
jgi:hypothetical protein